MSEWNNTGWSAPQPEPLKAKPHCCEEASLSSHSFYIPCNNPATKVVGWKGRSDSPIRMCEMCADHNVKNRGGYVVEAYTGPTGAAQVWPTNPTPSNPWDAMNEDALLLLWNEKKKAIETAKEEEMELRKYIVKREFPKAQEGTNNKELGEGYKLKAVVKFNYTLADNDTVEKCLDHIAALGNEGSFIADRLVSWKPNFLKTEYNELLERKDKGDERAIKILGIVEQMLTITEAAPTLDIVEPKAKKK